MSAKHALRIHVSNGRRIALMRRKWAVLRVPVDSRAVNHDEGNGGPPLCELRASLFRYKEFINISSRKQKHSRKKWDEAEMSGAEIFLPPATPFSSHCYFARANMYLFI